MKWKAPESAYDILDKEKVILYYKYFASISIPEARLTAFNGICAYASRYMQKHIHLNYEDTSASYIYLKIQGKMTSFFSTGFYIQNQLWAEAAGLLLGNDETPVPGS